jgi:heme exporter protein A
MTTLQVQGLTKHYGRTRALSSVDLQLQAGRACALVGPNGAGKTTFLAILASLVRPTSGKIFYDGEADVSRREIGFCSHAPLVYGDMTPRQNLEFFARLYDVAERRQRSQEVLARLGLLDVADQAVRSCSRGTQQRLAIARAVLHRPRLVLLDEPFVGLDPDALSVVRELIRDEAASGAIVLLSTHYFAAADCIAQQAVALRAGRIAGTDEAITGLAADALRTLYGRG